MRSNKYLFHFFQFVQQNFIHFVFIYLFIFAHLIDLTKFIIIVIKKYYHLKLISIIYNYLNLFNFNHYLYHLSRSQNFNKVLKLIILKKK